jgi:uncharacterized protein (TIGR03032 family)
MIHSLALRWLRIAPFEPLAFCRGYLRGLSFIGDFAVVGLSLSRGTKTFEGLALEDEHAKRGVEPMCAIQVIDLRIGDIVHWLRTDGIVEELYVVVVLPGVRRPMAIGFRTDGSFRPGTSKDFNFNH